MMGQGLIETTLVAGLLLGASSCAAPARSPGEAAFDRNCRACHAAAKLPGTRVTGLADQRKRMALDQFLARHHAPDRAARREIIDYLAAQEK